MIFDTLLGEASVFADGGKYYCQQHHRSFVRLSEIIRGRSLFT
jgi:hypothetical protein